MSITSNQESVGGATAKHDDTRTGPRSIGFGTSIGLMGATQGSEYTNTIATVMKDMYASLSVVPKVTVFDREQIPQLAYSCVVVSQETKGISGNKDVAYHITLLEVTGQDPLKASDIVSETTRFAREQNTPSRVFTPSDALNKRLNDIILDELVKQYGNAVSFISTDGLVAHATSVELTDLGMRIAAIARNSVHTEVVLSTGEMADLNLAEAIRKEDGSLSTLKLEYNMYNTTVQNLVGTPTRQDFKVDLVEISNRESHFELNADTRKHLVSIGGYIEAIREELPVPAPIGMVPTVTTRLHPNIIVTNNDVITPTHGFMLLGLAAATVMSNPELMLQSLASIDSKSPNNPGALNILTNIENGQTGTPLTFDKKKISTEEHYAALKQMYSLTPVISQDVEVFGPQAYYTSLLVAASTGSNGSIRADAASEIIEACVQLTDGHFSSSFDTNSIFAGEGIVIPMGYWMDKSGERDIRDIDLAFIANQTGDVNLLNKWAATSLPRSITGLDPFLTRVEIISQLVPDAVINGKSVRVTYTDMFVKELTHAIERAGVSPSYESNVVINEQYGASQFTDYLAAAGLSTAVGFARRGGNAVGGMYTPAGMMGQFRG